MSLYILRPLVGFWYMHSQSFRIATVLAQDKWKEQ